MSSCLPEVLRSLPEDPEVTLVFLRELWPLFVGNELAARTAPKRLSGTTLTIDVPDEVWRRQIRSMQPLLLRKINESWGRPLIERIRLRLHPINSQTG